MPARLFPRPIRVLAALLAAIALGALAAVQAQAADQPESIRGRLEERTAEDERNPIEGVRITVEGDGFSEEAESDDEGVWEVELPGPGAYTATLDEETLPEGLSLRDPADNPWTGEIREGRSQVVRFNLGVGSRVEASTFDRILERGAVGLRFGLLLALASVGLSLIFGTTGLTNFAHAEQVSLGGLLGFTFGATLGLPFVVAGLLTVACCAAFGWGQDATLWKPLRRRGIGLIPMMIVTIGLSLFVRSLLQAFYGTSPRTYPVQSEIVAIGPIRLSVQDYISMGISLVALLAVGYVLLRTRWGKATRAVSDNPALAAASGIDVDRIIRGVWTSGAALAGLGGMLLGLSQQVSPQMGQNMLLLMFAAVVLGGLGTAFGAMVGAIIVGMFVEISTLVVPSEIKNVGALAILILILLVRPQGILGRRERIG
ncbi:MAG TPA: branched-chain amino acid ABC transporter permease [Jiangellaceae bacterium]